MGDIVKHITELIEDGRYLEEPRPKYKPLPQYEDWEYDSGRVAGSDQAGGDKAKDAATGEQKKDQ
jgi:hypothetical protein